MNPPALHSVLCRRESSGCTGGGVGVAVVQEAVKEKGKVTRTFIKVRWLYSALLVQTYLLTSTNVQILTQDPLDSCRSAA